MPEDIFLKQFIAVMQKGHVNVMYEHAAFLVQ